MGALDTHDRIIRGAKASKTPEVEADSGETLEHELTPVSRGVRSEVQSYLPEGWFDVAEEVDDPDDVDEEDIDLSEAMLDEDGVEAWTDMLVESIDHDELAPSEIRNQVECWSDKLFYEAGAAVIEMGVDTSGVKSFRIE
jgi:hypothetical protein